MTDNYDAKNGIVKRAFDTTMRKVDDFKSSFSAPTSGSDESIDGSDKHQGNKTDGGTDYSNEDKIKQDGTSLGLNTEGSITKTAKTSNATQDKILKALDAKYLENEKLVMSGKISDDEWVKKEIDL